MLSFRILGVFSCIVVDDCVFNIWDLDVCYVIFIDELIRFFLFMGCVIFIFIVLFLSWFFVGIEEVVLVREFCVRFW